MKLTFFGRLRDEIGMHEFYCSPPETIADSELLRAWIGEQYSPVLDRKIQLAIDGVLARGAVPIAGVREVAFLPPVSGG